MLKKKDPSKIAEILENEAAKKQRARQAEQAEQALRQEEQDRWNSIDFDPSLNRHSPKNCFPLWYQFTRHLNSLLFSKNYDEICKHLSRCTLARQRDTDKHTSRIDNYITTGKNIKISEDDQRKNADHAQLINDFNSLEHIVCQIINNYKKGNNPTPIENAYFFYSDSYISSTTNMRTNDWYQIPTLCKISETNKQKINDACTNGSLTEEHRDFLINLKEEEEEYMKYMLADQELQRADNNKNGNRGRSESTRRRNHSKSKDRNGNKVRSESTRRRSRSKSRDRNGNRK